MDREQRLRMKIQEIEDILREFSEELERISEANLRKSDNEYNRWVHNRFFDTKDTLVERIESETTSYINTLHEAVSYLCSSENKNTKVTLYPMGEYRNVTVFLENEGFESIKADLIKCPSCGSWVHKHCFSCACGHTMGTDVKELAETKTKQDNAANE